MSTEITHVAQRQAEAGNRELGLTPDVVEKKKKRKSGLTALQVSTAAPGCIPRQS